MKSIPAKQNLLTVLFLLGYLAAVVLWFVEEYVDFTPLAYVENGLYILLLLGWAHSIRTRLFQKGLYRYLIAMAVVLASWFLIRTIKYHIVTLETDLSRYLWYLYYFPMMFYPVFALMASCFIGKPDEHVLPKGSRLVYLISTTLFLLVMTNDLHQWIFVFPEEAKVYSDSNYHYGTGYFLVVGWFLLCTLATLVHIFRKCRLPGKKQMIVGPVIPISAGLLYNIAYITGHAKFYSDFISVMSLCTICALEICIRTNLIRSNSNYPELLKASALPVQLMDAQGVVIYSSDSAATINSAVLSETVGKGVVIENGMRFSSFPIKNGCTIWQEDISELLEINEELEDVARELEDQYSVSQEVYQTAHRRQMLVEKNRLYNMMQNVTADKVRHLTQLTECIERSSDEKEIRRLTGEAAVLCAYIKRRNNLIFIREDSELIDSSDLIYCIRESLRSLNLLDITTDAVMTLYSPMTLESATRLYDMFETAAENIMQSASELFLTLLENTSSRALRMNIVCTTSLDALAGMGFKVTKEDENEWVLMYEIKKGGESE